MNQRKGRLILIISLLLISGFVITSLASYYVSLSSLRSQITQTELPLTSDNIYSEIQRDLLRPIFISSLMANDTFLRDWVIEGEVDEKQIVRYLNEIQTEYKTFTTFFVSEKTRNYYQSKGVLKKVEENEKRDNWYFRVRSMASDYEINVDPDMANNDSLTIFINYRVFDYNNQFLGSVGVGLTVNAVKDLIKRYQKNYDRNIYFIDSKGKIILHSSAILNNIETVHQIEGLSGIYNEIIKNPGKSYEYKRDGKTVYLNTRYLPEFKWILLVAQTDEESTKPVFNALLINMLICFVITAIVIFLTHLTISFYQRRLEKMATTDKLTGIYNRQALDIFINQIIKDIKRKDIHFSVILFDIDHFKQINDDFGHIAGDQVIKNIVELTKGQIRESDIFCRWGGEEFLILLRECKINNAYKIAEQVRQSVNNTPTCYENKDIHSTISLGVSQYEWDESIDSLLSRVDKALYVAKGKGRNATEVESLPDSLSG